MNKCAVAKSGNCNLKQ